MHLLSETPAIDHFLLLLDVGSVRPQLLPSLCCHNKPQCHEKQALQGHREANSLIQGHLEGYLKRLHEAEAQALAQSKALPAAR